MVLARDDWTTRIVDKSSDSTGFGRRSTLTFTGGNNKTVSIISAYGLPKSTIYSAGPTTAYVQQWHLLRQQGIKNPDPIQLFWTDLGLLVQTLTQQNHEIILVLDANDTTDNLKSLVSHFIDTNKLTGVITYLNLPNEITPPPATYIHGKQRIDYAFASSGILPHIRRAGYDPFHALLPSDHRGIVLDIALTSYFQGSPSKLGQLLRQGLSTREPKRMLEYMTALSANKEQHKIHYRAQKLDYQRLQATTPDQIQRLQRMMNAIDRDITRGMLHAEQACKPRFVTPWSPLLHKAHKLIRFWKTWETEILMKCPLHEQRAQLLATIADATDLLPPIPRKPSLRFVRCHLRKAICMRRKCIIHAEELRRNHLWERAHFHAMVNHKRASKIAKAITKSEDQKQAYQKIQVTAKGHSKVSAIKTVSVPIYDKDTKTLSDGTA